MYHTAHFFGVSDPKKVNKSDEILTCSTQTTWFITESQNHRMFGFGKDLCGSSSPTLLPKQGHLQQAAQDLSRRVLNISREGESTASLGSLFQCFVTLRVRKFFLMFRCNFLCFSLCPLPLVLSLGTTEKSLAPSF